MIGSLVFLVATPLLLSRLMFGVFPLIIWWGGGIPLLGIILLWISVFWNTPRGTRRFRRPLAYTAGHLLISWLFYLFLLLLGSILISSPPH